MHIIYAWGWGDICKKTMFILNSMNIGEPLIYTVNSYESLKSQLNASSELVKM